jgi:ABC-type uncharacterized transport system, permease component
MKFKTYLSLFRIKFISALQYRTAALAGISTQLFFGGVFIMVYVAFYESNNTVGVPMDMKYLVNYLWLNQAFFALTYIWMRNDDLLSMIKNGNVAYELCRPVNFYFKWFFTIYGTRIANVTLRFLPVLLISYFLPSPYNLTLPSSFLNIILFIISLFISSIIVVSVTMIIHLIVFFTLDEKGIITFLMVFGEIFAGGTVPLAFFPNWLRNIANILPFKFLCDTPFNTYNYGYTYFIKNFGIGILWCIVLISVGYILSKKALKCASVQGG